MYKKEKTSGRGIYKRIVEDWEKKHLPKDPNDYIDPNKIEQAVSRYKKLLNADI